MARQGYIAVDLGAESGRVVLGALDGQSLWSQEVHRFRHRALTTPAGLCWDLTGLWDEILAGLQKASAVAKETHIEPLSVGVDTWGVDWSLVNPRGTLLGLPRCYRDPAFSGSFDRAVAAVGRSAIYEATGIQLMSINTLYQFAEQYERDPSRCKDSQLMFMPDMFHWMLSGKQTVEETIASTSQMFDTRRRTWAKPLLEKLDLPTNVLGEVIPPGTVIGTLLPNVAAMTGLDASTRVIAPPSHDTAAAVAAIPAAADANWAFLSSGTWSLLGAEIDAPCITDASHRANFTNELGIDGTVRFLKNVSGLWLVQECRRQWEREGTTYDYVQLTELASQAEPFRTLIPIAHPAFTSPPNMIDAIQGIAKENDQPIPTTTGQIVRCCLESLALQYNATLAVLEQLLGRRFDVLHVVGGGTKNALLTQATANATGRRVYAGPDEATAMGNLLTQAMGLGHLKNLTDIRAVARNTFKPMLYEPKDGDAWATAATRYATLKID